MADNVSYQQSGHYNPPYYPPPQSQPMSNALEVVNGVQRNEPAQRRRPKYTRSKTGCMTCRVKKIKCDETKPSCIRCVHGQRDCTWPEGVPQRKKPPPKRAETLDSIDMARPSTASSSGISGGSTPPTRDHTPPKREHIELGLPPLGPRRHSEPHMHSQSMQSSSDPGHRSSLLPIPHQHYPASSSHSSSMLSVIPEMQPAYLTLPPVDHLYPSQPHQSHQYMQSSVTSQPAMHRGSHGSNYRYVDSSQSHSNGLWQQSSAPPHLESSMDSYVGLSRCIVFEVADVSSSLMSTTGFQQGPRRLIPSPIDTTDNGFFFLSPIVRVNGSVWLSVVVVTRLLSHLLLPLCTSLHIPGPLEWLRSTLVGIAPEIYVFRSACDA
ncbi:hypothetical protein BV25DRAFT_1824938 [Artomyces pyxidatus]|uniref:Uncharacterized protein n=1 Tax=Artomyces pyxidatus TaxID=48021 RepID=A0ACB8T307_9AGAM|nr:hypothetical protein BV25DRAFT_1824938 [Artomyces pyxidatus]